MSTIVREITPLKSEDLFILLNNKQAKFDYQIHFHSDYELNMVCNTSGKRIVGDSVEEFNDFDMILLGSNLPHVWKAPTTEDTHVITIQFPDQILNSFLMKKRLFAPIRDMLERSLRGLDFSAETKLRVRDKIIALSQSHGFNTALDFFSILYELATSQGQRNLASSTYDTTTVIKDSKSRRIAKVCNYIEENYKEEIKLTNVAELIGMSDSAFSHFFKKRTNRSFISYLNDVRIGHATKMLFETTHSVSEIAFLCGFCNISNFNRIFKKSKGQTPSEYRASIQKVLTKF
ncbi:MAG TPA: AraC family transcriptional regulator [Bacteroidales bacterium]|nr:AraC family transcriptional regulator [Bacteroidales bacterium]HPT11048.1 AraC family transcriptional regulator [Bacteroidales bacterium]